MSAEFVQSLFAYHYGRFGQVWDSIMTLSDAQFLQDVPYSLGSLRNHMVHLVNDDAKWIALVAGRDEPQLIAQGDYQSREATRQLFDTHATANLISVKTITDEMLDDAFIWHPHFLPKPQQIRIRQALVHIVNHGTDHRGQILRILHDFGAPTFDQDLMGYLIQTGETALDNKN